MKEIKTLIVIGYGMSGLAAITALVEFILALHMGRNAPAIIYVFPFLLLVLGYVSLFAGRALRSLHSRLNDIESS